ncbi:hypothetical protein AGMMS49579_01200 [Spirochaetia bacterium]|nr:hypothetical protein AGMMS49579_01200 [Spirochaetia bacterium]
MFIRCVTCNKILKKNIFNLPPKEKKEALLKERLCCRRHYLTDVDTMEYEIKYNI